MELEERLLMGVVIEELLRDTKHHILHDFIHIEEKKLQDLSSFNRKKRKEVEKYINKNISELKKSLQRSLKYNNELLGLYNTNSEGEIDTDYLERFKEFFLGFVDLFFQNCKETGNYRKAILKQSEKGNIFLNGNKYEIFVDDDV